MRISSVILLGLGFMVGCSKNVRINIPPDQPIPVMTTLIGSDTTIAVDLSYSKPVMEQDKDYPAIKGAKVGLFVDNTFIEELEEQTWGSYYLSKYKPAPGEHIRIEAMVNDKVLKGETVVPVKPEITAGSAVQTTDDAFGNRDYRINFSINDKPGTHDYYRLRIFRVINGNAEQLNPISFIIENIKSQDGGIFDDFTTPDQNNSYYFDDESFNGQNFEVQIKSKVYGDGLDKVAIELSAISREAYLYFRSIQLQSLRNDDPLYEKVPIYSNVVNGLGIVGAFNTRNLIQEQTKLK